MPLLHLGRRPLFCDNPDDHDPDSSIPQRPTTIRSSALLPNPVQDNVVDIRAENIVAHDAGLRFNLIDDARSEVIDASLLGRFNVENLLACYASLRACSIAANEARHGLMSVTPVDGRMERFGG